MRDRRPLDPYACRCDPRPVIIADFTGPVVRITRRHWIARLIRQGNSRAGQTVIPGCGLPDEDIPVEAYIHSGRTR